MVAGRLRQPGEWLVLVHGNPCPDNVMLPTANRAVLVDLEFARPGHALLDAAYWRMAFPTCWCAGAVPADPAARIERMYRNAMREAVPAAADDTAFRRESAFIDAAWLLGNLSWLLKGAVAEDGTWGRGHQPEQDPDLSAESRSIQRAGRYPTTPSCLGSGLARRSRVPLAQHSNIN